MPNEPKKSRPAVVVEDDGLFAPDYPNILVVPLTSDPGVAMPSVSVTIDPTPENGCERRCFALAPSVTAVSIRRVRATPSRIRPDQLAEIRRLIGEIIGLR